jgi:quercetin dioxygenase-like cupin family protein
MSSSRKHLAQTGVFFFAPPNALHQIANPRDDDAAEVVLYRNAVEEI